ncbi:MAG TPA: S-methyl-5-thioribose-1-phosphate isomerase [Lentimicrobium sp.]|nr:S-methyl-5-thioribose-1-phosphate isomerase [Lentimicrobium sp.]
MKVNGRHYKTIWLESSEVVMIDQNKLPFEFTLHRCVDYKSTCTAIINMTVRGAGAIGAAAGFAMAQAFISGTDPEKARLEIINTRPTARDLFYAVDKVYSAGMVNYTSSDNEGIKEAIKAAQEVAHENENAGKAIGIYGNELFKPGARVLTHCNAGWLAFVDYGSALAPIYEAHHAGKNIHVYVDETRPRGQGARLTAWELNNEEVPHTIIPDNAAALLMSRGIIDLVITGADRIAANGDTANKIGTLEKAILAKHYGIPFYIAAPSSTIDLNTKTGNDIIIEERSQDEVLKQTGMDENGTLHTVLVASPGSPAYNPAFDVTPAEFITGYISEKGITSSNILLKENNIKLPNN